MQATEQARVIQSRRLSDYFHHQLLAAAQRRHLGADAATLHYLTLLLSNYARSEAVFDYAEAHRQIRPLALLYAEAQEASGESERRLWLQRLGDLALFVGGWFSGQLSRHFCDRDYCVSMGGNAFAYLEQTSARPDQQAQALVFGELAEQFEHFVDLVAVVTGKPGSNPDH